MLLMWMKMRPADGEVGEPGDRPVGSAHRDVPHPPPGLGADTLQDHLVVRPQGAVHEEDVRTVHPRAHVVGHLGAVGEIDDPPPAAALDFKPQRVAGRARHLGRRVALEVEGQLAGCRERPQLDAQRPARGVAQQRPLSHRQRPARDECPAHDLEDRVGVEDGQHAWMAVKGEGGAFAQVQEARHGVDVAVGQHHRGDGGRAQSGGGLERRRGLDLLTEVGRGVDDHPALTVRREGDRGLRRGQSRLVARPRPPAGRAGSVPLREAAAGRGAEDAQAHVDPPLARPAGSSRAAAQAWAGR